MAEIVAEKFLNQDRTAELWAAVKTALAGKADLSALDNYTTPDTVATAIATALTDYAKNTDVTNAITTALVDYVTKTQMDAAIQQAIVDASGITVSVVDTLPETGTEKVIYLVPSSTSATNNIKDEYLWVDNKWELVGSTAVDLSNYWNKDNLQIMTASELEAILV